MKMSARSCSHVVLTLSLIVPAALLACDGVEDGSPEAAAVDAPVTDFIATPEDAPDGEGPETLPGTQEELGFDGSENGCGENTLLVLTDDRNATYTICIVDGSVLIAETVSDARNDVSLSARHASTKDLIAAVLPADVALPPQIFESLDAGRLIPAPGVQYPVRVGESDPSLVVDYCSDVAQWQTDFVPWYQAWANTFVNENYFTEGAECTSKYNNFSTTTTGWHQFTASAQHGQLEDDMTAPYGGSCATRERIYSCGGSTFSQIWQMETPSGSFGSPIYTGWIAPGTLTYLTRYANSTNSCEYYQDRDDMRFRADSETGATHLYGISIIKYVFEPYPCDADPA